MAEEKKIFKVVLIIALLTLNAVIIAYLVGFRLPQKNQISAKDAAPIVPKNLIYLPLVSQQDNRPLSILPNETIWLENQGGNLLHIVGEVHNNTSTTIQDVLVVADLSSKNDKKTSLSGSPLAAVIPPGEKACFHLFIANPPKYDAYELYVLSYGTGGQKIQEFETIVSNASLGTDRIYTLSGIVKNPQSLPMDGLRVVATLYDPSGKALGCEQSFLNVPSEDPSEPASFSIYFMDGDFSSAHNYQISLAGIPQ